MGVTLWKCKNFKKCSQLVRLTKEQQQQAIAQEKAGQLVNRRQYVCVACASAKSASGTNAKSGDLQEMQGYMNSYGLAVGGIVFPGVGAAQRHSASGNTLVELPLRPGSDHDGLLEHVRNTLATMWSQPELQ